MLKLSTIVAAALLATSSLASAEDVLSEVSTLENEYFNNWSQGAQQAADALGLNYRILSGKGDAAKQIEIYEAQFANGVKITFGENLVAANIKPIVEMASKAGATHVAVWSSLPGFHPIDAGPDNYAFAGFFSPDGVEDGYRMAKLLFDKIGGKGNVVHITGFPGADADTLRTAGFDKALAEYPDIKLIARQPGKWNQIDARKVMEDLLVAHPDINASSGRTTRSPWARCRRSKTQDFRSRSSAWTAMPKPSASSRKAVFWRRWPSLLSGRQDTRLSGPMMLPRASSQARASG
jgi:ABC-type sugar transport system substrate-binding protein